MIKECKIDKVGTCKQDDVVIDVAKKLHDTNQRHVYVVDNKGEPVGIISTVDISAKIVAEGKDAKETKAKDIMNLPVDAADVSQDEEFALKIMMERNTFACPVVENKKLKGTVSYKEIFSKVRDKLREAN